MSAQRSARRRPNAARSPGRGGHVNATRPLAVGARARGFTTPLVLGARAHLVLTLPLALGACAPPAPSRPQPARAAAPDVGAARCPGVLDAAALLERHARGFGTAAALAASLPRTTRVAFETEGKAGTQEVVVDATRYRSESSIGGIYSAVGDDGKGPWALGAPGVLVRLRPDEAADVAYGAWLERRAYLGDFDPRRDEASCELVGTGAVEVTVRYRRPELGEPRLTFDAASGALVRAEAAGADGRRSAVRYGAWGEPDGRGVRWPEAATQTSAVAEPITFGRSRVAAGLACEGVDRRFSAEGCLAPPAPDLRFEWPAGAGVVRVPMRYYQGELLLRVTLGGRPAWALLDSGAGLTVLDATTPAGEAFRPSIEVTGAGVGQKVRMGLGEVEALAAGALTLRRVPVASVPIPALATFGERRPEVILGYSLFLGAAVRVDYAKGEIAFARAAPALVRPGSRALPFRILGDALAVEASVEGARGVFELDTGNSGGFDLYRSWADARGLLAGRPSLSFKGRTGAGAAETVATLVRVREAELGFLRHDDRLAAVDAPPDPGAFAGLVGNRVLARCAAVVFDVERRTLWLEPPCDRPSGESNAGWRLGRAADAAFRDRPWVLEQVFAGGAAERAGLRPGDRLLAIEGAPAASDPERFGALVERPVGTKLRVTYAREGRAQNTTLELRPLLAAGGGGLRARGRGGGLGLRRGCRGAARAEQRRELFADVLARQLELAARAQVFDRDDALGEFVGAQHEHEAHAGAVGVLELLGELRGLHHDLGVEAGRAQAPGELEVLGQARAFHVGDERGDGALGRGHEPRLAQLPEEARRADRDAHAGQLRLGVVAGEVVVAAARADRADAGVVVEQRFVDRAGVVVEAARDREVEHEVLLGHPERLDEAEHLDELAAALFERGRPGAERGELGAGVVERRRARAHEGQQPVDRAGVEPEVGRRERGAHVVFAALVELVDLAQDERLPRGLGDAEPLEKAPHQLAVVEVNGEGPDAEVAKDAINDRRQLGVVADRERIFADDVDVALVEFAKAPRLVALAAVDPLHLVAPKGEGEIGFVLGDVARERHGEIEA